MGLPLHDRPVRRGAVALICERCPHYRTKTIFRRKCYYEPQCPVGVAIKLVDVVMTRVRAKA